MKKIVIVVLLVLAWQKWDVIDAYLNPLPDFGALHDNKVVLYATSWCGYCAKAREFFAEHKIDYFEYNIETSAEGKRQYDELNGRGIPLVLVNGKRVQGYRPDQITQYLKTR